MVHILHCQTQRQLELAIVYVWLEWSAPSPALSEPCIQTPASTQ